MSDAHAEHDLPHEGPIKTPKQLIWAVVLAFVVPIVAIILLVNYVVADKLPSAGSDGLSAEAVARRIQPVGEVALEDARDPASLKSGEQVYAAVAAAATPAPAAAPAAAPAPAAAANAAPALYAQACAVCHASGVANAPKLGDKAAWAPRLAAGVDGLTASAIKGKGAMPPKGAAATASDADIKAVVAYMVASVK